MEYRWGRRSSSVLEDLTIHSVTPAGILISNCHKPLCLCQLKREKETQKCGAVVSCHT